jgi:hypothetical protein
MASRIFDLNSSGQFLKPVKANSAAPASLDLEGFVKKTISAANTTGEQIDIGQCDTLMAQVIVTAVGASLAGGAIKLQGSITGGSQDGAWFDITASVNVTAIESSEQHVLTLSATYAPCQFKFVRLHSTVTVVANSNFDMYGILHVRSEI